MAFHLPDRYLVTSLALAARNGDFVNLKNLLSKGRRADIKDNRGWNALHEAAFSGASNCVDLLLRKECVNKDDRTFEGETALFLAIKNNRCDTARILVDNGADINIGNNEGRTPLHEACRTENLELVKLLMDLGAECNDADLDGWTPLYDAIVAKSEPIVEFLLSRGSRTDIKDDFERLPVHVAASCGFYQVLSSLAEGNADYINHMADGRTPLMLACQSGNLSTVKLLLDLGADPYVLDNCLTPIHVALHLNYRSILECLLSHVDMDKLSALSKSMHSIMFVAFDGQAKQCLPVLLKSQLPRNLLEFFKPIHRDVETFDSNYHQLNTIGSCLRSVDNPFDWLEPLLDAGFPPNADNINVVPPAVALIYGSLPTDTKLKCLKILVEHGADLEYNLGWTYPYNFPDIVLASCCFANEEICSGDFSILQFVARNCIAFDPDQLIEFFYVGLEWNNFVVLNNNDKVRLMDFMVFRNNILHNSNKIYIDDNPNDPRTDKYPHIKSKRWCRMKLDNFCIPNVLKFLGQVGVSDCDKYNKIVSLLKQQYGTLSLTAIDTPFPLTHLCRSVVRRRWKDYDLNLPVTLKRFLTYND